MSGQDQNPDLPLPCMRGRRPGRIFVRPPPRHGHKPTWLAGFVRGPLDGTPDAETALDMQRVYMSEGLLTYSTPLTADRLIDGSFSKAAVEKLGPYKG